DGSRSPQGAAAARPLRVASVGPCGTRVEPRAGRRSGPAELSLLSGVTTCCLGARGHSAVDYPVPGVLLPDPYCPPFRGRRPAVVLGSPRGGAWLDRRDLPPLPVFRCRGNPGRRPALQVCPADPRRREPRAALGRTTLGADRHDRLRSFGGAARAERIGE